MSPAAALKGVSSPRRYSPRESPIRSFSLAQEWWPPVLSKVSFTADLLLPTVLHPGDPLLALREGVESHEEGRPEHQHEGDRREEGPGELGIGGVPQIRSEAELLEGHVGDVEPPRPAHLVLPVDVVNVPVGVLIDPGLRDLQQGAPHAELQGPRGARPDAGGDLPPP